MGFMTLADFRDDVKLVLGGAGESNTRVDRWINKGLHEASTDFRHEVMIDHDTIALVQGQGQYTLPAGTLGIIAVRIPDLDKKLIETGLDNLWLMNEDVESEPSHWAIDATSIFIRPIPNATSVQNMELTTRKEPPILVSPTQTTIFPSAWDAIIADYAKSYALHDLNRATEATTWFNRAQRGTRKILKSQEYEFEGPSLGVEVPTELAHVVDQV